jgi:hypothetical protein
MHMMHMTSPNAAWPVHQSPWKQPSSGYWLCIPLAATRGTANKASIKNIPTLLAFLMAVEVGHHVNHLMEKVHDFPKRR